MANIFWKVLLYAFMLFILTAALGIYLLQNVGTFVFGIAIILIGAWGLFHDSR